MQIEIDGIVYDVRNNINENKFTRTGYAFDSWNTMPDGSGTKYDDKADITNVFLDNTTLYAQWAVTPYTVIFNKNHADATGSMNNQEIAYGQQVALTKNTYERTGYTFTGWNTQVDGQGTHYDDEEEVKNLDIDGEVNLYAEWEANKYTITFDKNDSYATGTMNTQDVTFEATETLIANSFANYQHTFKGWNTKVDGTGTHYSNEDYITINNPNDFILYAEWEAQIEASNPGADLTMLSETKCTNNENITLPSGTVCKRAINLHEEVCVSGQCVTMGYTETGSKGTNIVSYGSCGTQGTLTSGDAFTCDVDGNGVFDEKLERFYYVSDYFNTITREFEDDTAVLIYYSSVDGNGQRVTDSSNGGYCNGSIAQGPVLYRNSMPKSSLWRNVSLKNNERAIIAYSKNDGYSDVIEAGELPSNFSYEGYSARLLTVQEAQVGCNMSVVGNKITGETDYCYYMYENSRFVVNDRSVTGNIGIPFENPLITHNATGDTTINRRWILNTRSRNMSDSYRSDQVIPKPVIEVPKSKISY